MGFRFDDFQQCLNQTFTLQHDDYSDEWQLIQVDRNGEPGSNNGRDSFSVVFQSQKALIPQQTYRFIHQQMGEMELFVVPIGQDDAGVRYEAVFS